MEAKTVQLRCKDCGGIMTVEENKSILSCPYCGSKEFISESDHVKIEKIKNDTQKEIELKKLEFEERERRRKIITKIVLTTLSVLLKAAVLLFVVFLIVGAIVTILR